MGEILLQLRERMVLGYYRGKLRFFSLYGAKNLDTWYKEE